MIKWIIKTCAENRFFTILSVLAFTVWGAWALRNTPLDAIPDLSDVQVIVFTEWPGRSPDIIEDQVTYPIVTSLVAAPKVQTVRGISMFGTSFIYVIFDDGTDMYWARSRVLEYLNTASKKLPQGVAPTIGPDATGVGWVFQYALVDRSGRNDLARMRGFQDWFLRYGLSSVEGVAEVASVGGFVKQLQVHVDPGRLVAYHISLGRVVEAIRRSNNDVGGEMVEVAGEEHMIRGRGYLKGAADLESVAVGTDEEGRPILLRDMANVQAGPEMRRGIADLNGEGEVVGGIVVMRYGQNALDVIDRVKARLEEVKRSLPEGVELVVTYDRSDLIQRSIRTLKRTLVEEMVIVSLVILVFLMHLRSALIPVLTLPIAVALSFIPMFFMGFTANIMSLGGIAVAIGAMVDAAIVMVENAHKHLDVGERGGPPATSHDRAAVIVRSFQEVGPSIFFALLVITVSFLPVFTLQAQEGRLFKPLAYTKTFSMFFASLLAVTLAPALGALFIRGRIRSGSEQPLNRLLVRLYEPVVRWVVEHRRIVIGSAAGLLAVSLPVFFLLEREFMPPLNEGSLLNMPTAPPGISAMEARRILITMDRELKKFPEVESVFGKIGRAETPTDPAPMSMAEIVVNLKPMSEWPKGMTWDGLVREMDAAIRFPGMPNLWWMPVQTRTEMLSTGIRSLLGVKVFGPNLKMIEETAVDIEHALKDLSGTRSAYVDRPYGGRYLDFKIRRDEVAKVGLTVGDVEDFIEAAVGGVNVTSVFEGRERYNVNVRLTGDLHHDPDELRRVLVPAGMGGPMPLEALADIEWSRGPSMIQDEDGNLVGYVLVDVVGRGISDYVEDARRALAESVHLPPGVRIEWAGQFKYLERAKERLKIVVPLTLLIVFMLLYMSTRSTAKTLIVLLAVPFSLVGSAWLLWALGYRMSVAVWVGLIALAGLDAETGVVMLLYLDLAYTQWKSENRLRCAADLTDAIVEGAARRIRPKMMTVAAILAGLLPIMFSHGTGSDVMRRIAAPMIGGVVTSFILELLVYPAIFAAWKGRALKSGHE